VRETRRQVCAEGKSPDLRLATLLRLRRGRFATSALDRPSSRSRRICRGCCDAAARRRATTGPRRAVDVRPSPERRQLRATPGDVARTHSTTVSGWLADTSSSRNAGQDKERHAVAAMTENPQHLEGRLVRPVHGLEKQQSRHGRLDRADLAEQPQADDLASFSMMPDSSGTASASDPRAATVRHATTPPRRQVFAADGVTW